MAWNSPGILEVRDTYRYFPCQGTRFVQLNVIEQPVDVGFGTFNGNSGAESATFGEGNDQVLFPGSNPIPQSCDCIRYRNHTRGVSGRITIAARQASDLPPGVELSTSYVPSYFIVTPEGRIQVIFEGKILAQGVELREARVTTEGKEIPFVFEDAVSWSEREFIQSTAITNRRTLRVVRQLELGVKLNSEATEPFVEFSLEATAEGRGAIGGRYGGVREAGVDLFTLTNQEGRSSFLRFAGEISNTRFQIGEGIARFPVGGSQREIALPIRWATRGIFAGVSILSYRSSAIRIRHVIGGSLEKISIILDNESGAEQEITFGFISAGI